VAAGSDKDQQTEKATPKRLDKAKQDGDVLQSRELGTALMMCAATGWLSVAGPWFVMACQEAVRIGLDLPVQASRNGDFMQAAALQLKMIGGPLASLFALMCLTAIAGPFLLGSLGFRSKGFAFKAEKIDPIKGIARIFGIRGLIELGKAMLKVILLCALGYWVITAALADIFRLGSSDIETANAIMGGLVVQTFIALSLGVVIIGGIDVPIQMIQRNNRLKMTRQQVKEEMRESDGAPEIKQAQRQRQYDILTGSARKGVESASVILTNPTHFAVALRYDPAHDNAPIVVAKGRGAVAAAIRSMASEHDIILLEYPELARAIYFTAKVGQSVAEDLYLAVATVLAFVFNLDRERGSYLSKPLIYVPDQFRYDEFGRRSHLSA
jgi:flagellar biosynthetic protein FlhB